MSNSKATRRSVGTAQLRMREMDVSIIDTDTTPTAIGFDEFGISSVVDNGGLGDYTINIRTPFGRDDIMGFVTLTGGPGMAQIGVINRTSVQVLIFDPAGAPADIDFFIRILGSEFNYNI